MSRLTVSRTLLKGARLLIQLPENPAHRSVAAGVLNMQRRLGWATASLVTVTSYFVAIFVGRSPGGCPSTSSAGSTFQIFRRCSRRLGGREPSRFRRNKSVVYFGRPAFNGTRTLGRGEHGFT